jgi:tRNA(Arg) A34 adenosine deaminase TadA
MPQKSSPSHTKHRHKDALAHHRHWLVRAQTVALQPVRRGGSPHPTIKVGAVLVDHKGREIAAAANRFAYGVDRRRPERTRVGAKSLWINCAEQIVIAKALRKRADLRGASLYVTLEPCAVCAGLIGELRLKNVFVPADALRRYARLKAKWKNSIEIGLIKLAEAGARVTAIDTRPAGTKKRTRGKTRR